MSESSVNGSSEFAKVFRVAQSIIQSRADLASRLGKAFGGDRDYYEALGYKTTLYPADYLAKYDRQDIASRIVNAYPDSAWQENPFVYELDADSKRVSTDEGAQTEFEIRWRRLATQLNIYHYMHRLDRLAGLGRYAILLFGFADNGDLKTELPLFGNPLLRYVSLFSEEHAEIQSFDTDFQSPRFGLPLTYRIELGRSTISTQTNSRNASKSGMSQIVHHSRVLHVAQNLIEDDVYGTPRLRPVYNLLDDLLKVAGGAGEAFWRNASRDLIANLDKDAQINPDDLSDFREQIDEFVHNLRRVLRVQGMEVTALSPEIESPKETVEVILDLISGAVGIPKRKLVGSERGELASSQDEGNWISQVETHQIQFAEPTILRPFIDKMIQVGILPTPANGYEIEWPSLFAEDENQRANRVETMARALSTIAGPGQALTTFPLPEVRERVLEWEPVSAYETDELLAEEEEANDDDDIEDLS